MADDNRNDGLLTVREFAELEGTTRQAVYNRLNGSLKEFTVLAGEDSKVTMLKPEGLSQYGKKRLFTRLSENGVNDANKTVNDTDKTVNDINNVVKVLTEQLTEKDRQIKALEAQLAVKDRQLERSSDLEERLAQLLNQYQQLQAKQLLMEQKPKGWWDKVKRWNTAVFFNIPESEQR